MCIVCYPIDICVKPALIVKKKTKLYIDNWAFNLFNLYNYYPPNEVIKIGFKRDRALNIFLDKNMEAFQRLTYLQKQYKQVEQGSNEQLRTW